MTSDKKDVSILSLVTVYLSRYLAAAGAKRLKRESPCPVASAFLSAPVIGSLGPQPLVPGSSLKAARQ